VKLEKTWTLPTKIFMARVLRSKEEDVGVFASSEEEARGKILALYEEKGIDVYHLAFVQKPEESCDKKIEVPTTEHSIPK